MKSDETFWVKVHAAEALILNVYPEGVEDYFQQLAQDPSSSIVGISRVFARLNRKNASVFQSHVDRIRDEFLDIDSPNRIGALESLGKLGYAEHLPEIIETAENGSSDIRGFARWVLANTGNPNDEAWLAELLNSDEPKDYFYASYALRFMQKVTPQTYERIESCVKRLTQDAPHRVYVMSNRFVHAPPEQKAEAKSGTASLCKRREKRAVRDVRSAGNQR